MLLCKDGWISTAVKLVRGTCLLPGDWATYSFLVDHLLNTENAFVRHIRSSLAVLTVFVLKELDPDSGILFKFLFPLDKVKYSLCFPFGWLYISSL